MQDFNALEGKSLAELREIGRALGVGNVMLKKKELLEQIRAVTLVAAAASRYFAPARRAGAKNRDAARATRVTALICSSNSFFFNITFPTPKALPISRNSARLLPSSALKSCINCLIIKSKMVKNPVG